MKRWLPYIFLSLALTIPGATRAQGWEPSTATGEIEVLGYSGDNPTLVHFKPVTDAGDVFSWDWSFQDTGSGLILVRATRYNGDLVEESFATSIQNARLMMTSALRGEISAEKTLAILPDDLVIQDDFEDLGASWIDRVPPSCRPDLMKDSYLKFTHSHCTQEAILDEKEEVSGDVICLGPGGGPGGEPGAGGVWDPGQSGGAEPPRVILDAMETAAYIALRFNIDSLNMINGGVFDLLALFTLAGEEDTARIEIQRQGANYVAYLNARETNSTDRSSALGFLGSTPGDITLVLSWKAGQSGHLNGVMQASLWFSQAPLTGPPSLQLSIASLDNNGMYYDHLRLGLYEARSISGFVDESMAIIPPGGFMRFDKLEMRRENPVSPLF